VKKKLACQAIDQIRGWLEEERKAKGEEFIPRMAIKFCGGCNPMIERGVLAETIRQALIGRALWVTWEEKPDFVLIINGCLTACADRPDIQKGAPVSLVIEGQSVSRIDKKPSASRG